MLDILVELGQFGLGEPTVALFDLVKLSCLLKYLSLTFSSNDFASNTITCKV